MNNNQNYHISLAKDKIEKFLLPGDAAVDATVGNGYDTLFLAKKISPNGKLYGFDIQKDALANTQNLLASHLPKELLSQIFLHLDSHENFKNYIHEKVNLFIYNLGYLPGSNKKIITTAKTTVISLTFATQLLDKKGAVCVTAYKKHPLGAEEETAVFDFFKNLPHRQWSVIYHNFINRENSPTLFWAEKK